MLISKAWRCIYCEHLYEDKPSRCDCLPAGEQQRYREVYVLDETWNLSGAELTPDEVANIPPLCPDKIAELVQRLGCSESEAKRELIKAPTTHK